MTRPTGKEFDALVKRYAKLKAEADEAARIASEHKCAADAVKDEIITQVKLHGVKSSEASMRMKGDCCTATVTTGRMTKQNDAEVERLRNYLATVPAEGVQEAFFTPVTTYQLVGSPAEVVAKLSVPARIRARIKAMVAVCFEVVTKAPSLKVDVPA